MKIFIDFFKAFSLNYQLNDIIFAAAKPSLIWDCERIILRFIFNDLIAQLVEHLPFKEVVLGSSPSQVTKKSRYFYRLFGFFWHLPRCWTW